MDTTQLPDRECVTLENKAITLQVTKSYGPRVISLCLRGGRNLFADVPHLVLDCPGKGGFHLHGGHRLWYAPEIPATTYIPDNAPVEVTLSEAGMNLTQPVERDTGVQKSIRIRLPDESATVILDHTLANMGSSPVTCAPWAITMMKPGGVAILPQNTSKADQAGVLPNRSLVLWPYTDPASSHITWGKSSILVHANLASEEEKLKLGFPNPRGWLAYHLQDTLFVKYAAFQPSQSYYDFNSSSQCYCGPAFIELETLGPQVTLAPGESVSHKEAWQVFREVGFTTSDAAVQVLVEKLSLDKHASSWV